MLTATGLGGNVSAKVFNDTSQRPPVVDEIARARQVYEDGVAQSRTGQTGKTLTSFRKAAELGAARAMVEVGEALKRDGATTADEQDAARWFHKTAEAGNVSAMVEMGLLYSLETGVPEDFEMAAAWYRTAVDYGSSDAMYNFGEYVRERPRRQTGFQESHGTLSESSQASNTYATHLCQSGTRTVTTQPLIDMRSSDSPFKALPFINNS